MVAEGGLWLYRSVIILYFIVTVSMGFFILLHLKNRNLHCKTCRIKIDISIITKWVDRKWIDILYVPILKLNAP